MAARLVARSSSSSGRPAQAATAKEAVARALVLGFERAREAVGGSWMFVKRMGWPGTWRDLRCWARRWDVAALKVDIFEGWGGIRRFESAFSVG